MEAQDCSKDSSIVLEGILQRAEDYQKYRRKFKISDRVYPQEFDREIEKYLKDNGT